MAKTVHFVLSTSLLLAVQALKLQDRPEFTIAHEGSMNHGSTPGSANPVRFDGQPLYLTHNSFREEMGERMIAAAHSEVTTKQCEGFVDFGDYTWCAKAMPDETEGARNGKYGPVVAKLGKTAGKGSQYVGLSFGIRADDSYSQLLSNRYLMHTKLYDCFWAGAEGPMKNDLHAGFSDSNPCPRYQHKRCYTVPYEAKATCVGKKDTTIKQKDGSSLKFETFHTVLKDHGPLSAFVKMDVEGSEWDVLEELLENEEDMAKIRSLSFEIHLNHDVVNLVHWAEEGRGLTHKVELMEKLAKKFAVVGSDINNVAQANKAAFMKNGKEVTEPVVYPKNGFSLDQFCISYVNRALL